MCSRLVDQNPKSGTGSGDIYCSFDFDGNVDLLGRILVVFCPSFRKISRRSVCAVDIANSTADTQVCCALL